MRRFAVIVAGGTGSRMRSEVPKQFLPLAGKPILLHTLERFLSVESIEKVVLVLPQKDLDYWQNEILPANAHSLAAGHPKLSITIGGNTRFNSVKNGLAALVETDGLVAIHDGVRPIISADIIEEAFRTAAVAGSAVVCVSLKDSIRQVSPTGSSVAADRSLYRLVQTPQTFRLPLLLAAYEQPESPLFTDDASVVEAAGHKITLVEGDYRNIKLTTPEDMAVAEVFLKKYI